MNKKFDTWSEITSSEDLTHDLRLYEAASASNANLSSNQTVFTQRNEDGNVIEGVNVTSAAF